jgi:glycosyltransferase involved in cell wall biosynthesis
MGFALPVPAVAGGAVEKRWHGLAVELARRHEVTLYSCRHAGLPDEQHETGLRHVRLPGFRWSNRRWLNASKSVAWSWRVARRIEPGDVLLTNDVVAPILLPHLRKHLGLVCIDVARMPKLQHRWLYHGVDRFYCTSSAVADCMASIAPGARQRSIVLPNSTDLDCFSPAQATTKHADRLQLLYVGRIHPEKGLDTLLRALPLGAHRSRIFLRLVGPAAETSGGDPGYADQLRELAGELGLTAADWRLDPPVFDDRQLAGIYRQAAIFAYPSRAVTGETFGISVLEAMGCGKPCLVSPLACFRDLVHDGDNGLVVHGSQPADWAAAIDRLVSDAELANTMGRRSRQLALAFSPAEIALRLEHDLEHLLATRRNGRK